MKNWKAVVGAIVFAILSATQVAITVVDWGTASTGTKVLDVVSVAIFAAVAVSYAVKVARS